MNLKNRILLILILASILTALATGAILIFLIQLHGQVSFADSRSSMLTAFAVGVYLLGGLFILGVLSALLGKMMIIWTNSGLDLIGSQNSTISQQWMYLNTR